MHVRLLVASSLVIALAVSLRAGPPATQGEGKAQTGTFTAKFAERSPLSAPNELSKRLGEKQAIKDYDLSQHEFIVHVPPEYDPARPAGVMFLLLYKDAGEPPAPCLPMLAQKNLIFIVPKEHALPM